MDTLKLRYTDVKLRVLKFYTRKAETNDAENVISFHEFHNIKITLFVLL